MSSMQKIKSIACSNSRPQKLVSGRLLFDLSVALATYLLAVAHQLFPNYFTCRRPHLWMGARCKLFMCAAFCIATQGA